MDYNFWFVNWYALLLSFILMGLAIVNLNNLGALKGLVFRFSILLVITSFLVCAYTNITAEKIGATCEDGWHSYSTGSGTCSHHGGVETWKYKYWFDK